MATNTDILQALAGTAISLNEGGVIRPFFTQPQDGKTDEVNCESLEYTAMLTRWDLPCALMGGTLTMREQCAKWLPQESKETAPRYAQRVARCVLFEAYKNAITRLCARPFARAVALRVGNRPEDTAQSAEENTKKVTPPSVPSGAPQKPPTADGLPSPNTPAFLGLSINPSLQDNALDILDPRLREIVFDVDNTHVSLTQFCQEVFGAGVHYGHTHILVDYPAVPENITLAEEREKNIRPVFLHIPPTALIGWKTVKNEQNQDELTEIRIAERRKVRDGKYRETWVDYIRTYTQDSWELHKYVEEKTETGATTTAWVREGGGKHTFGKVPLVTFYTKREGFMTSTPAMEPLAWINLAHFQSSADQRNILRFARLGILFGSGLTDEQVEQGVELGPSAFVGTTSEHADLKYVEHNGEAIGAGRQDLLDLEAQMEVLALEPILRSGTGSASATGRAIDEANIHSLLQAWVIALQMCIYDCFSFAAMWIKQKLPESLRVDIYNDFAISPRTRDDILALIELWSRKGITQTRLLTELKRRILLEETMDVKAEVIASQAEARLAAEQAQQLGSPDPEGGVSRLGGTGIGSRQNLNDNNGGQRQGRGGSDPAIQSTPGQ